MEKIEKMHGENGWNLGLTDIKVENLRG